MQAAITQFQRHQLQMVARVTPHAMAGHIINTTVLAIAVAGTIPRAQLIAWCTYSYAVALLLLVRHFKARGRSPRNFQRAAIRSTVYAVVLALPWSVMALLYLGSLPHDQELLLVALGVGMAASGTILLSAVPAAAFGYMSGILLPSALKCVLLLNQRGYLLIGVLGLSYWYFLAALITKIRREIAERQQAEVALQEGATRLQEALTAGQVMAFDWDMATSRTQRSANAGQILGLPATTAIHMPSLEFLAHVHREDIDNVMREMKGLSEEKPVYFMAFRFVRPDGGHIWLETTGKAEFDATGRALRIRGLSRDITEHKRAEERQRLLVRELDHRVKNTLASVATVARRTREGSVSMDEFLATFDGRIQSLANAHALLSRSQWQGVSLAELVGDELAPFVGAGNALIEGPQVLLTAGATQPVSIVLHELATNAGKYGALSSPQGRISVRWGRAAEGGGLWLEWIERGGPAVVATGRSGYGTGAIRSLIPYELDGTVDLAFAADGLTCRIELPAACLHDGSEPADGLIGAPAAPPPAAASPAAAPS